MDPVIPLLNYPVIPLLNYPVIPLLNYPVIPLLNYPVIPLLSVSHASGLSRSARLQSTAHHCMVKGLPDKKLKL